MEIYRQIHDLNINLDQKVDEKTMEINTLVQKQKEYISMISHELRSPITSSLFLAENLVDGLNEKNVKKIELERDATLLSGEIQKTADFIKNLFSVERYDIGEVQLFKEKQDMTVFLLKEKEIIEKTYPQVHFDILNQESIIEFDAIQF